MGKRPTTKKAEPAAEQPDPKKPVVKEKRSAIEIVEELQNRFSHRHHFSDADAAIVTADLAELYELL